MSNVSGAVALIGNTFQAFSPLRHPCSLTTTPSLLSPLRHPCSHHSGIHTLTTVPSLLSLLCHPDSHHCAIPAPSVTSMQETSISAHCLEMLLPNSRKPCLNVHKDISFHLDEVLENSVGACTGKCWTSLCSRLRNVDQTSGSRDFRWK